MKDLTLFQTTAHTLRKLAAGITQARIGQARAGLSLSTAEVLKFNLDHALARDAVHAHWKYENIIASCAEHQIDAMLIHTNASQRDSYLLNPNLGSFIRNDVFLSLKEKNKTYDICLIVTDGLSAQAIETHFCHLLFKLIPKIHQQHPLLTISPIIVAPFGRVALSDHVGDLYHAKIAIIFVGERPGLSSVDSMGIYCTPAPKIGRTNADRYCISNIRPPFGLNYDLAIEELLTFFI